MVGIRYITRIKKVIAIKNIESSIRLIVNVILPLFQVYILLSIYLLYIRIFLYATKIALFDKINNGLKIITTLSIKSLPPSLCQREVFPSFKKRGKGRFSKLMSIQFRDP